MRLICPNCEAQYEVPDSVMPPDGRDVQCSNCGNQWFQAHPDHIAEDLPTEPQDVEPTPTARPSPKTEQAPLVDQTPSDELPVPPAPKGPMSEGPKRRELDPAVADVLRAEAELEARARQDEGNLFESQPDLGLPETVSNEERRSREARDRMARLKGEEAPRSDTKNPAGDTTPDARRDLLPDIEEINSTLRSNNDRAPNEDPGQTAQMEEREKRNSRRGFTVSIALIAILACVYVFAGELAEAVPQLQPALDSYVAVIDNARAWINAQMAAMMLWLDAAAANSAIG